VRNLLFVCRIEPASDSGHSETEEPPCHEKADSSQFSPSAPNSSE
jgi:hypothetical protein